MHCTCIQGPIIHAEVSKPGPDMGLDRPVQRNFPTTLSPEISISVMLVNNCSGERSFFCIVAGKERNRVTVSDKRLNALCYMAIENN